MVRERTQPLFPRCLHEFELSDTCGKWLDTHYPIYQINPDVL